MAVARSAGLLEASPADIHPATDVRQHGCQPMPERGLSLSEVDRRVDRVLPPATRYRSCVSFL